MEQTCVPCLWNQTESLWDQARLMRRWLDGELSEHPGHAGPPEAETTPLVPALRDLTLCGLVPVGSQPARDDAVFRQVPFLELYGEARQVRALHAALRDRHDVWVWPMRWRTWPHTGRQMTVTSIRPSGSHQWTPMTRTSPGIGFDNWLPEVRHCEMSAPASRAMSVSWGLLVQGASSEEGAATLVEDVAAEATSLAIARIHGGD